MKKKLRIGIIVGGRSGEHEVSIRSARAVIESIDKSKYEVVPIAITKEGNWLGTAASIKLFPDETQQFLADEKQQTAGADVAILGDPSRSGLVKLGTRTGEPERLD